MSLTHLLPFQSFPLGFIFPGMHIPEGQLCPHALLEPQFNTAKIKLFLSSLYSWNHITAPSTTQTPKPGTYESLLIISLLSQISNALNVIS